MVLLWPKMSGFFLSAVREYNIGGRISSSRVKFKYDTYGQKKYAKERF
jgi:hypothetical protein